MPAVAALALALGGAVSAHTGPDEDNLSCSWEGKFEAAPGFNLAPRTGTFGAANGTGTCSGELNRDSLRNMPVALRFAGTYDPQSTCSSASGAFEVEAAIEQGTVVHRLAGAYEWRASGFRGGGYGRFGGGGSQLTFSLSSSSGCTSSAGVSSGAMSVSLTSRGDLRRLPNARPASRLEAAPERVKGNGPVDIDAEVSDPDGSSDLRIVTVVLRDNHGRALESWIESDFKRHGATTLRLAVRDFKLSGPHPWRVELVGRDRARHEFERVVTLRRK